MRITAGLITAAATLISAQVGAYLVDQDTQISYGMYYDLYPAVAYSLDHDEHMAIMIQSDALSGGDGRLLGQRLDGDTGERVGNSFLIGDVYSFDSSEHGPPHIAYSVSSDRYLAVWGSGSSHNIYARQIAGGAGGGDDGGQLIGDRISLCADVSSDARNPRVAFDTEHHVFLVVWDDTRNSDLGGTHWDIYGQRIDSDTGALLGGNIRITPVGEEGWWPDVAYSPAGDHFLVAWARRLGTGRTHRARRVEYDGDLLGSAFSISRTDGFFMKRPGVCYWPGMSRFLVTHCANNSAMAQVVAGTAGGGDGGGELIGDVQTLGRASQGSLFEVDQIPGLALWLVTWNYSGGQHYKRGCFVQSDGTPRVSGFAIDTGTMYSSINTVVSTHSTAGPDQVLLLHTDFGGLESDVFTRPLPQMLSGAAQGEMEGCDFLRVNTDPIGWNMIGVRPSTGDDADIEIYPSTRFFWGDPLAESGHSDPGRAEIIAVNAEATGAETLNLLLTTTYVDTVYYRADHAVRRGILAGDVDTVQSLDIHGEFLHAWNLRVTEGVHRVINVIPADETLDFQMAVFQAGTVPVQQYVSLDDVPSNWKARGMDPGRVETIYVVPPATGDLGLAVWLESGSGSYRLIVRDPDEPTTEEIVLYLLGRAGIPWGGDVNGDAEYGDPGIDVADVVANILAGR